MVRLGGSLDVHTMGELWRELETRLRPARVETLDVEAGVFEVRGGGGLALLRYLKTGGFTPEAVVTLHGLRPEVEQVLNLFAGQGQERNEVGQRQPPWVAQKIG